MKRYKLKRYLIFDSFQVHVKLIACGDEGKKVAARNNKNPTVLTNFSITRYTHVKRSTL